MESYDLNADIGDINAENDTIADTYFQMEKKIKEILTTSTIFQFNEIYTTIDDKKYFNNKKITNLNDSLDWVININTVATNHGDMSTSTLQKFFHLIFDDDSETDIDTNELAKFKNTFIETFCTSLISNLNSISTNDEYIGKFEIKHGYINIYLKQKGKAILNSVQETKRKKADIPSSFQFNAIGYLESCFPEKFSVPRQGNLLKLTRGKIVISPHIDNSSFEGLENFDYIWIIYVFHLNQNFAKSKISPPKFEGSKLGIYATRTPHRHNPIGLTLAKLERIENGEIFISSVDMITGTPILDIKPYHHLESLDMTSVKYPDWIKQQASAEKKANVIVTENAVSSLEDILKTRKLIFYDNKEEILELIKGILEIDPHSKYTRKKKETLLYAFYVDKLNVIYEYNADMQIVTVHDIEYSEEYKKLRNKQWLESYKIK